MLASRPAAWLALVLASLAAAVLAGSARAHGDPAIDVLIAKDVFLPFGGSGISSKDADALTGIVRESNQAGYRIKVAVIASKSDLELDPSLWRKPQAYARFLGGELLFAYKKGRLLIVMPNGFGLFRGTMSERRLLSKLPTGSGTGRLARSSTTAVERLAGAAGHEPLTSSEGSSSSNRLAIALGGVAVLALISLATYLFFWRSRHKEEQTA